MIDGIELPNQEKNQKVWRKGNFQVLGNIGSASNKQAQKKEKIKKEYLRKMRKPLETQLY